MMVDECRDTFAAPLLLDLHPSSWLYVTETAASPYFFAFFASIYLHKKEDREGDLTYQHSSSFIGYAHVLVIDVYLER